MKKQDSCEIVAELSQLVAGVLGKYTVEPR